MRKFSSLYYSFPNKMQIFSQTFLTDLTFPVLATSLSGLPIPRPMSFLRNILIPSLCLVMLPLFSSLRAQEESTGRPEIPEDLLEDEHLREEMGVNQYTSPSIRKIFDDLRGLRPLPYDQMKRSVAEQPPQDRIRLALTMGVFLADGFFAVEAEQFFDLEPIGRSLLNYGKVLGSGTRVSSYMKSVLEKGAGGQWDELKEELVRAQRDVEKEMVLIRDVDVANLISLGGWLRALEVGCGATLKPYDPAKAAMLAKPEVVEYFVLTMETFAPRVKKQPLVDLLDKKLLEIEKITKISDGEVLSEDAVQELQGIVEGLVDRITGSERLLKSTEAKPDSGNAPAAPVKTPAATGGVISGEVPEE